jgi:hypothetical protein
MIFSLATTVLRANETFKVRIEKARSVLGDKRSDAIIAELTTHCRARCSGKPTPNLKEMAVALEAALVKTSDARLPGRTRHSSILELAPGAEDHGGYGSVTHAVAAIRFYFNQCKTAEDREAFHTTAAGSIACAKFKDLAIVAAILAGEQATELDISIFEARAAKDALTNRPYIRRGHHE